MGLLAGVGSGLGGEASRVYRKRPERAAAGEGDALAVELDVAG